MNGLELCRVGDKDCDVFGISNYQNAPPTKSELESFLVSRQSTEERMQA